MQNAPATIWSMQFLARRDLRIQRSLDDHRATCFNVLDPITRQSYRIGEFERAVLMALSSSRTLRQTLKWLQRVPEFATSTEQQLLAAIEQLRRCGMVRAAHDRQTLQRSALAHRSQAALSNFVVWQLRGLQPDAWLSKIAPYTNAFFTAAAVRWWLILALVTCCAVLLEFPRLASQSNSWEWVVHPVQGSALFVIFLVTRALHELGHAIVCKRHGIRCPDIGLFVILGAPCVYCDVSESWQLPSRWQRAAVAAAGMYVELIVATLAAWVWMITIDGPVNTAALQTMFVCSISTVLINANPLMRFDGYYILSDILDESNLRGRADAIAEAWLQRIVLGKRASSTKPADKSAESGGATKMLRALLFLFSWCGWVYRAGLSLAIAALLVALYDAWQLAWVGRCIAVLILFSWWGVPSVRLAKSLMQTARKTNTRWRLTLVAAALLGCVGLLPIPYRQFASGWVQPVEMQGVFVATAGSLEHPEGMPKTGKLVEQGNVLFRIHDTQTLLSKTRAEGLVNRANKRMESHRRSQSDEHPTSKAALESATQMLKRADEELENLNLKAPCDGRLLVMPATASTGPWSDSPEAIACSWSDSTQRGRFVPTGTMLAAVCDDESMAVIPLSDEQLEWIAAGTEVRVRCLNRPDEVHVCHVLDIVNLHDSTPTLRLLNSDATQSAAASAQQAANAQSANAAARVRLPEGVRFAIGAKVDGVFIAPSKTIAELGWRWLQQNLRWLAD